MKTHIIDFDKALAQARQSGGRIQLLLGKVLTKCPLNGEGQIEKYAFYKERQ